MAPEIPMETPLCLIENRPDGTFVVREEAMGILLGIRQPVVVVAIVGLYRTGKSYLMNRLAGRRKGFCLGATVQGQTKGIWMWCFPHPLSPGHMLVLLDTEGLGDVQKGNTQNDSWIFALATLLSSTLVYNSMGTIDQVALEKLHYVTELTKKIHTKSSGRCQEEENSAEFVCFFPAFIWAVRDFTLQLEIDGLPVTEDEYLESALKLQPGDTDQIKKCNMPRVCIREFFPSRKCFTFDRPTSRMKLHQLEVLQEEDLEPDFLEPATNFCNHIWNTSQPKTLPGGRVVSGAMLSNLAKNYVEAINSGQVPCLENAVLALAEMENAAAVREAISHYEELMETRLDLPTVTVEELLGVHAECEREATGVFMARAFHDNIEKFQDELVRLLLEKKTEFYRRNKQVSLDRCLAVLTDLSQELEDGITQGIYSVPGGYERFLEKQHEIEENYRLVPGKGIQADEALQEFLKSKKSVAESILQTDKRLSDKEKEIEAERARAQEVQVQQEILKQNEARLRQMVEDEKRSHEEQLRTLQEKVELEKKALQVEMERAVEHKLKEQEQMLKEEFDQKASELQCQIEHLKANKSHPNSAIVMSSLGRILNSWTPLAFQFLQDGAFSTSATPSIAFTHSIPALLNLTKSFVEAINSRPVPCLENVELALAETENAGAVYEAVSWYEELMEQRLNLPTETVEDLLGVHAECEREATGVFMARALPDNIAKCQEELVHFLLLKKNEFYKRNEQVSSDRCLAVLTDLSQELEDGIAQGLYSVSGGYQRFLEKQHEIEERYHVVPGKGIQADEALHEFLKSQKSVAESILQTDKRLTDKEKEIEAERAWAQEAQFQQELLKQNEARLMEMVEDQKRSHEEQLRALQAKAEIEKKVQQEEMERAVEHKLKEQEQLLNEVLDQARKMECEIEYLKANSSPSSVSSVISALPHTLTSVLRTVIPTFARFVYGSSQSIMSTEPNQSNK